MALNYVPIYMTPAYRARWCDDGDYWLSLSQGLDNNDRARYSHAASRVCLMREKAADQFGLHATLLSPAFTTIMSHITSCPAIFERRVNAPGVLLYTNEYVCRFISTSRPDSSNISSLTHLFSMHACSNVEIKVLDTDVDPAQAISLNSNPTTLTPGNYHLTVEANPCTLQPFLLLFASRVAQTSETHLISSSFPFQLQLGP